MSRSYKKHEVCKQQNTKGMKQMANRHVRRNMTDLPSKGKAYKKLFQSWDICDWKWIWTKQDAIREWNEAHNFLNKCRHSYTASRMTLEEYLAYWEKCTKRK